MENKMLEKMPRCTLKVTPHIESRVKQLKKHHNAITKMMWTRGGSGFGWNDKDKMIVVEKEIYQDWVKIIYIFLFNLFFILVYLI